MAGADLVVFVVDARTGITPADAHFATWLRRQGRPVLLVANKAEGRGGAQAAMDAYSLGIGAPLAVSAEHGDGLADLMGEIADRLPEPRRGRRARPSAAPGHRRPPECRQIHLLNRLLGEDRMITGPEPGLTRDCRRGAVARPPTARSSWWTPPGCAARPASSRRWRR